MPLTTQITQHIQAPPEKVFAALTDLDSAEKWMPNLVRIERLTGELRGPGMKWRETRRMFGREAAEVFEVKSVNAPHSVELFVDGTQGSSRKGWYKFVYRLTPRDSGTDLTMEMEVGGLPKLMELIGKLFMGPMKKACEKDMSAMRGYIESQKE